MENNRISKMRIISGIIIFCIFIGFSLFAVLNRDSLFVSKMQIRYPDGCIENYTNDNLTSEKCVMGRALAESERKLHMGFGGLNAQGYVPNKT